MTILHQMQMSGNCYKVRLIAHQLGIPITLREYPLHGGETRQPAFLARNANGRVPLLELDDGRYLPESGAIIWYLSEGTGLQPADQWTRAQALSWMFFEQYSHEPYVAVSRFWLTYAPKEELETLAFANEKVKPFVEGKQIVKVVVVPDRLVNIVVR